MSNTLLKLIFILLPFQAFCLDRLLEPIRFADQQEFYIKGGMGILSQKKSSVIFYSTTDLMHGKANLYFVISNDSNNFINFLASNVQVTDQFGRPVRVVPVEEHLHRLRSEANMKTFFNIALGSLEVIGAAAGGGRVDYHKHGHTHAHGFKNFQPYSHNETYFETGTYYSRTLQRAAEREAMLATCFRGQMIHDELDARRFRYENFYLSSNTIEPNSVYSANFHIEVPKFMLCDLQYLYFTFNVGGEAHRFAMYTGNAMGRQYCRY